MVKSLDFMSIREVGTVSMRDSAMSTNQDLAVEVRGVSHGFRSGFWLKRHLVIHDIQINITAGEVFGLLGMNGAGKTTLIHLMTGLRKPVQGEVRIFGYPAGSIEAKRQIGFLPERPYFQDYLTGEQLLRFHGNLAGLDQHVLNERIDQVLRSLNLWNARGRTLRTYSKGMLQKIGIAQALIHEPRLLILDEPMSGLDPVARREMKDFLIQLRKTGRTVLLTSHVVSDIEEVCTHLGVIKSGILAESGVIDQFLVNGSLEQGITRWYKRENGDSNDAA